MKVEDIAALNVKGFLDNEEGLKLYELAVEASKHGPCLEIGGYCGKSTLYLGLGCQEGGGMLFSIDHHRGSEEQQPGEEYFDPDIFDDEEGKVDTFRLFRKTVEGASLGDTVVPVVSSSKVVARSWSMPLSLVFIDGSHSYESAFSDYTSWAPHIVPGGFLAIHDIFPDPEEGGQAPYFIYTKALSSGLFVEFSMIKTLGVLKRLETGNVPETISGMRDW
jgi:predicted O-methyltransferase YrrM